MKNRMKHGIRVCLIGMFLVLFDQTSFANRINSQLSRKQTLDNVSLELDIQLVAQKLIDLGFNVDIAHHLATATMDQEVQRATQAAIAHHRGDDGILHITVDESKLQTAAHKLSTLLKLADIDADRLASNFPLTEQASNHYGEIKPLLLQTGCTEMEATLIMQEVSRSEISMATDAGVVTLAGKTRINSTFAVAAILVIVMAIGLTIVAPAIGGTLAVACGLALVIYYHAHLKGLE